MQFKKASQSPHIQCMPRTHTNSIPFQNAEQMSVVNRKKNHNDLINHGMNFFLFIVSVSVRVLKNYGGILCVLNGLK